MNISIDTTPFQDIVIQFKTDKHNAGLPKDDQGNPINPLTPRQYVIRYFQSDFDAWKDEFRADRLATIRQAYLAGTDAKRAQIEAAAQ